MRDYEITIENRRIRTRGLAERGVCDIVINDVAPEHESVGILHDAYPRGYDRPERGRSSAAYTSEL